MKVDLNTFWAQYSKYFSASTDGEKYHLPLILGMAERDSSIDGVYQLAYMLATATWETGHFEHLDEQGSEKYLSKYQNKIGNTQTGDAQRYRGRGYVQLTGRANYKNATEKLNLDNVDFETNPFLASEPEYAYPIMVRGSLEGWFTGHKLGAYVTADGSKRDYRNARNVINPGELKQENSPGVEHITLWASWFESILKNSLVENDQLPDIPLEYIVDSSATENKSGSLQAPVQASIGQNQAQIPTQTPAQTPTQTPAQTSTQTPIFESVLSYIDKTKDAIEASATTLKRLFTTLTGCISIALTSIGAFIKSEPVISGIVIIVALICLVWIISFYVYIEHILDSKRIEAASNPMKHNVK
ncbi:MAG: hypothetical protein HY819_18475 [Acidobacteria bacterium]|nr:hypothetical protein [Acidobacteriota bacterium]